MECMLSMLESTNVIQLLTQCMSREYQATLPMAQHVVKVNAQQLINIHNIAFSLAS